MFLLLAATLAVLRFAIAVYRMPGSATGDFTATLPGAYAKTLNPTLWNSPDLLDSRGYHREIYVYGPTQYLLLYPIVFLNSWAQIAKMLGVVYAGVLGWALYLMSGLLDGRRGSTVALPIVIALTLLFPPVYQAYIQREFELVVLLALIAATALIASNRQGWAGALIGFITWFKVWPIAFVGYFLITRRFKGLAAFILASCVTLGLAQLIFGLDRFVIFNPSISTEKAGGQFVLTSLMPSIEEATFGPTMAGGHIVDRGAIGHGFCRNWYESDETLVGARWAVCRLGFSYPWLPAGLVFSSLTLIAMGCGWVGFSRIRRAETLTEEQRRWSIIYEVSLVIVAAALVWSAHYYYLVYLMLPFNALAFRYLRDRQWTKGAWLMLSYMLLAVFLVPLSLLTHAYVNVWRMYMEHVLYFYGELILIALLLLEYMKIARPEDRPLASVPATGTLHGGALP